jgi:diguanylate cyclase (GGDEF)-like protein
LAIGVNRRLRRQTVQNAYLAEYDSLTGLPNRRAFVEAVQRSAAGPGPRMAAVAICDLDRFKAVNDALGHERGDELIQRIAERLTSLLRPGDLVARLGGDEFGILLSRVVSETDAEAILKRLRTAIAAPISVTDLPLTVEASIGYVLLPDDGEQAQTLLQRADIAMYVAKGSQGGVVRYDPGQDHVDADQLAVVAELQQALGSGTLRLDFQPKLELRDGAVEAVEALIRWHHPRHGELAPDAFLPVAEQTGLIDALTDWVIDTALDHARRWAEAGQPLAVAVNISARNLSHPHFAERVLSSVVISGVPVDRLVLEITETALLTDVERATGTLAALRAAGVGISIDDFGQGQTSLGLLARLPISELKLDRAFVTTMCADEANRAIVRSLIDLAHSLGLRVVGEGVEGEATIVALRTAGCDAAQGYAIARPLHADQVLSWCATRSESLV